MLNLVTLIPGVGPIAGVVFKVVAYIARCTPCMLAIAGVVLWIAGDIHGHRKADAKCKAADIAMQLAAAKRDVAAAADAQKFAERKSVELDAQISDLNKKVSDYEKLPHVACPLGDRAGGLRSIAPR